MNEMTMSKTFLIPELGISENARVSIADILSTVLADEHVLYIKLRQFHWNVTGPRFAGLHELFEEQYEALEAMIDDIAERIVQYGIAAPGTMTAFVERSRLEEQTAIGLDADAMIIGIMRDHEAMVRLLRDDIAVIANEYQDVGAEDLLTELMQTHQKYAWMARAYLGDGSNA